MTQQNNLLKLQKQLTGDVSTELSSHLTLFQDIFCTSTNSNQETARGKPVSPKGTSQTLSKKITYKSNTLDYYLKSISLKGQVCMLWEQSTGASEPAQGTSHDLTTLDSARGQTLEKSSTEDETLLLINIPSENRFSPHEPDIDRALVPTQENTI